MSAFIRRIQWVFHCYDIGEWMVHHPNAEVRYTSRSLGHAISYGWEVKMPDGNRYFSSDLWRAIEYAKGGTNPYLSVVSA